MSSALQLIHQLLVEDMPLTTDNLLAELERNGIRLSMTTSAYLVEELVSEI